MLEAREHGRLFDPAVEYFAVGVGCDEVLVEYDRSRCARLRAAVIAWRVRRFPGAACMRFIPRGDQELDDCPRRVE